MLDNVAPGEWAPESAGSVVLLSSEEFDAQVKVLSNVSYPSCNANLLACQSALHAVTLPNSSQNGVLPVEGAAASAEMHNITFAMIAMTAVAVALTVVNGVCFIIMRRVSTVPPLNNVAVIPPGAAPHAPATVPVPLPVLVPVPAPVAAAQPSSSAAASAPTVVTSVPAQLHAQPPTFGNTYPPAGQPGGS